jgi:hypothetical protein
MSPQEQRNGDTASVRASDLTIYRLTLYHIKLYDQN